MRINQSFKEQFPNNCPLIEIDGDGNEVGTCTFYLKDGVCPRHGALQVCPNCNQLAFVVGTKFLSGFAVGDCLKCKQAGRIKWPVKPQADPAAG